MLLTAYILVFVVACLSVNFCLPAIEYLAHAIDIIFMTTIDPMLRVCHDICPELIDQSLCLVQFLVSTNTCVEPARILIYQPGYLVRFWPRHHPMNSEQVVEYSLYFVLF